MWAGWISEAPARSAKLLLAEDALSAEELAGRFGGAKAELVRRHLEILHVMGEVQLNPDGRYQAATAASAV